jgi:hypothetical protein
MLPLILALSNPVSLAALTVGSIGYYAYKGLKEREEVNKNLESLIALKEENAMAKEYAKAWKEASFEEQIAALQKQNKALQEELNQQDRILNTL